MLGRSLGRFEPYNYMTSLISRRMTEPHDCKDMLGSDVLADLNRTITTEMLESTLKSDINRTVSRPWSNFIKSIWKFWTAITDDNASHTVAGSKVLMITSTAISLEVSGKDKTHQMEILPPTFFPSGTTFSLSAGNYGWTGMVFDNITGITPLANTDSNYTVPSGKIWSLHRLVRILRLEVAVRDTTNGDSSPPSIFLGTTSSALPLHQLMLGLVTSLIHLLFDIQKMLLPVGLEVAASTILRFVA